MKNYNYTYCEGHKCAIRESCLRYIYGKLLPDGNWHWMQSCDEETRDGYISK